jgi:hypothetical protein
MQAARRAPDESATQTARFMFEDIRVLAAGRRAQAASVRKMRGAPGVQTGQTHIYNSLLMSQNETLAVRHGPN